MSIGWSDGSSYDSYADYQLGNARAPDKNQAPVTTSSLEQTDDPKDQSEQSRRRSKEIRRPSSDSEKPAGEFKVDTDHHVPLVASALMNANGGMYGMAIDHRLNVSKDDQELLKLHEGTELPYMNDLVKGGMQPSEAYGEAHKWATARETAASIAKWGPEGHEDYKERMRQNAAIASEPSDKPRHLDAHTTRYGLDESEGMKVAEDFKPFFRAQDYNETKGVSPAQVTDLLKKQGLNSIQIREYIRSHFSGKFDENGMPHMLDPEDFDKEMELSPTSKKETNIKVAMDMEDTPEAELGEDHIGAYQHIAMSLNEGRPPNMPPSEFDAPGGFGGGGGGMPRFNKSESTPFVGSDTKYVRYEPLNEEGKSKGHVEFYIHGDTASLSYTRSKDYDALKGERPQNSLGPSEVRQTYKEFIKDHPEVKTITAQRISGARKAAGHTSSVVFDVTPEGRLRLREQTNFNSDTGDVTVQRRREASTQPAYGHREGPSSDIADRPFMTIDRPPEPVWPGWQDQPLRNRMGRFISRQGPLADTGPASFRNALRSLDIPTNRYPSEMEMRQTSIGDWMRDNPDLFANKNSDALGNIIAGAVAGAIAPSDKAE